MWSGSFLKSADSVLINGSALIKWAEMFVKVSNEDMGLAPFLCCVGVPGKANVILLLF